MKLTRTTPAISAWSLFAISLFAQRDTRFELPEGCSLPFEDIAAKHPIDRLCGPAGSAKSKAGQAQNRKKNHFCASGDPLTLTVADFGELHRAVASAGVRYGRRGLPRDRSKLTAVREIGGRLAGEGSLVQMVGYIDSAHYPNKRRGETANCSLPDEHNNDLHIKLGEKLDPDPCERVTAEVSPHFRPVAWSLDTIREIQYLKHPVRLSGQLFFDGSHGACIDGLDSRASSWEIHPAYSIDVCTSLRIDRCSAADEAVWSPLHEWLERSEDEGIDVQEDLEPAEIISSFSRLVDSGDFQQARSVFLRHGFANRHPDVVESMRTVLFGGGNSPWSGVDEFWPPPKSSSRTRIPSDLIAGFDTLSKVDGALRNALTKRGFRKMSYFWAPDGFVLVTNAQKINKEGLSDGQAAAQPIPWVERLSRHLLTLVLASEPGYHRLFAFAVTPRPFSESSPVSLGEAEGWAQTGLDRLPAAVGVKPYTEDHLTTALVYEFEIGQEKEARFFSTGLRTAFQHLELSGILEALKEGQ